MNLSQIKDIIEENEIEAINLKYSDLFGRWYHISFPARRLEYVVEHGIPFDGSSIPGMKAVESGDMIMMPDLDTARLDNFSDTPTLKILCKVCDADTLIGVKKDPRSLVMRAQKYMEESEVADTALWIPELEFYLYDEAHIANHKFETGYTFSSSENKKCLPFDEEDELALAQDYRKGYHIDVPFDMYADLRQDMVNLIEDIDIRVRYHHHEVGLAQHEIETELLPFPKIADDIFIMKDIIRHVALSNHVSATFMPKPVYNEAGNGMHFHIMLKKDGKNVFYQKGEYANLSKTAQYFVGGILKHGRSLAAFTNPSTNSYKRLLPGFEAPTKLFYGLANRSAAIRIPKYATSEQSKRIEFRTGDATCNPHLAMSALIMAGLDGVKNKILPESINGGPYDENVFSWSEEEKAELNSIPRTLEEALIALKEDQDYLLEGGVFSEELIEAWIKGKMKEANAVNHRPHPFEMNLYYHI